MVLPVRPASGSECDDGCLTAGEVRHFRGRLEAYELEQGDTFGIWANSCATRWCLARWNASPGRTY
jgi:hypothetical protein